MIVTQLLHNNCLSFRQLKCGESHMTYLARNTVKPGRFHIPLCFISGKSWGVQNASSLFYVPVRFILKENECIFKLLFPDSFFEERSETLSKAPPTHGLVEHVA